MKVTLESQDKVDKEVADRSVLLKNMLEDVGESDKPIPLPNVTGRVLKKDPLPQPDDELDDTKRRSDDIEDWDADFIKVDNDQLFELILAANYMDIKPLLDLGCKTVANMIKGKTPEQIREMFNIENDFTPEEEEQIRRENE
ncbi:hypothetical protein HDU93_003304 [Gonapodya sp. JEL0774]|nr:hypothetical protein HDU93_003304 [Gonapodya sp. JEL0774]